MNYLDIILVVLLGLAGILGFRKGLIIGLATLAALILGVWAGFYFADFVAGLIEKGFDYNGKYINIISFVIIFIAVIVLVHLLARMIEKVVNLTALGIVNKLGGLVFGVLKAAIILSVLIYFLNRFDEQRKLIPQETRTASLLFPLVEGIAPILIPKMEEYSKALPDLPAASVAEDTLPPQDKPQPKQ